MNKRTVLKLSIGLCLVLSVALFYNIPVILQDQVTEELTQDGGSISHQYVFISLRDIVDNLYCFTHCFPVVQKTISFNIGAIVVESFGFFIIMYLATRRIIKK